ncbi:cytochrome P450 [Xylariales sp. AK1849]|nr:cytochrome P450 [Xylariales sp. AK1849]
METPSLLSVLEIVTILGVIQVIYKVVYNVYISPLKAFPGPLMHAATSIPYDIIVMQGEAHNAVRRLHDKYGPIVRIRPNELSYIDGCVWKDAYGHRQGHQEWVKSEHLNYMNGVAGILGADRESHRRFRRSLAHAFSKQGLREQEPRIRHYVDGLVAGLAKASHSGPVDVVNWMSWTTTDVIGDLAFGDSFGCIESASGHHWISLSGKILRPAIVTGIFKRWGLSLFALAMLPRGMVQGLKDNYNYVNEKVRKRVALGKDRGDFYDRVLKHDLIVDGSKAAGREEGFTFEELESTAADLVLAGSETTATLLSGIIFHLLRNPDVHAKATREVRAAFAKDEDITIASVNELPYLEAVLQEGLRVYTPAPFFAGRVAPKGGDTIAGVFVPEGTRVASSQIVAFNSSYNFARPDEFVPERWLPIGGGRPQEFENDNAGGVFHPFSYGPRNCIGMNLAKSEMSLIMAKLLWNFDLNKPRMGAEEARDWERHEVVMISIRQQTVDIAGSSILLVVPVLQRATELQRLWLES